MEFSDNDLKSQECSIVFEIRAIECAENPFSQVKFVYNSPSMSWKYLSFIHDEPLFNEHSLYSEWHCNGSMFFKIESKLFLIFKSTIARLIETKIRTENKTSKHYVMWWVFLCVWWFICNKCIFKKKIVQKRRQIASAFVFNSIQ